MPAAIEIRGLTKYYGRTRGVEDLDLEVEEGEIFGFIGPNGAGKTTTIRTLLGLVRPTSGSVRVFGRPVPPGGGPWLAEVGYLPSEVAYYPDMTGQELLAYAAGFYPNVDRRWVAQLVERLQLDLSRPVRTYSLGNRKKLGIVQALLHRPRLLILDEPSSGLDPLIRAELFAILREVHAAGTTIFFSTHVLEEVDRLCHRVAMIRDGRLLQVAPVDDLPGRHMKIVTLRLAGGGPLPGELLARWGDPRPEPVPGKPGTYRLLVRVPVQELVAALAPLTLEDLNIAEPGIEDVFLTLYRSGNGEPDGAPTATMGGRRDERP